MRSTGSRAPASGEGMGVSQSALGSNGGLPTLHKDEHEHEHEHKQEQRAASTSSEPHLWRMAVFSCCATTPGKRTDHLATLQTHRHSQLKSSLDQQPLNEPRKSSTSINRENFPTISILNSTEMQRHSPRRGTPNNEQATAKMIYEMEGPCSKSVRPSAQRDEVSIGVLERTVLEGQFVRLGTPLQSDMVIVFRAIKVKV